MGDPLRVDKPDFWDGLYLSGATAWELGTPTPVFEALVREKRIAPGKTLVLGCGTGHDAVALARAGFTVTGVDFAPEAIARARRLAQASGVPVEFLEADIFSLGDSHPRTFDHVLEYVTYCAIDPVRRPAFLHTVSRLLKPGGLFIALFFPVESRQEGPPFGVDMDEVHRLLQPWFRLVSSEAHGASVSPRRGREVLTIWERMP